MARAGTLPCFCCNNTHSDAHLPLTQAMNDSNREEPMEEEVRNDNGEHAEVEDEVTYSSLSEDEDSASETISIENFFLIRAH